MAQMILTVPDPLVQDVVDAFAAAYGYEAVDSATGILNPESDVQFAKRKIREYVANIYKGYKVTQYEAGKAAVLAAAEVDAAGVDMA